MKTGSASGQPPTVVHRLVRRKVPEWNVFNQAVAIARRCPMSATSSSAALATAQIGSSNIPDMRGANLYRVDPDLGRLLDLYLPPGLRAHLEPHLDRLGALTGGELDELADTADKNGPVLRPRTRRGEDANDIEYHPAYRAMEQIAFGDYGLAALSHRAGVLGWNAPMPPAAKYAIT